MKAPRWLLSSTLWDALSQWPAWRTHGLQCSPVTFADPVASIPHFSVRKIKSTRKTISEKENKPPPILWFELGKLRSSFKDVVHLPGYSGRQAPLAFGQMALPGVYHLFRNGKKNHFSDLCGVCWCLRRIMQGVSQGWPAVGNNFAAVICVVFEAVSGMAFILEPINQYSVLCS